MKDNCELITSKIETKGIVLTKTKHYNQWDIINSLRQLKLRIGELLITIPAHINIGIKNWGKIDFLAKKHSYHYVKKEPKERKKSYEKREQRIQERETYFSNKRCFVCKGTATIFRSMLGKQFYICNSNQCDYKTKVIAGYIKTEESKNNEI